MTEDRREPEITVVLAAYRAAPLVARVIARVLSEPAVDLELVVVDDGSGDGTVEAIRAAIGSDPRARLIALERNGGLGSARRIGFSAATGRYVWNVDADDEWPVGSMRSLVDTADRSSADLVLASAIRRSPSGQVQPMPAPRLAAPIGPRDAFALLLSGRVTGHLWNKLVSRRILSEEVYTDAVIHSDLVMTAPLLARSRVIVAHPDPVYDYWETPGSNIRSRKPRGDFLEEAWRRTAAAVAAVAPDLVESRDYRHFRGRMIVLSRLRDAVRGDYPVEEAARRLAAARRDIRLGDISAVGGSGHPRDAALLALAAVSPAAFSRVMRR